MEPEERDSGEDQRTHLKQNETDERLEVNSCSTSEADEDDDGAAAAIIDDSLIDERVRESDQCTASRLSVVDSEQDFDKPVEAHVAVTMVSRLRRVETLIVLSCFVVLCYNQLRSSSDLHLTRPLPKPSPMFPNTSYLDVYDGDFNEVYDEILLHEMTATLYYAPWDARSTKELRMFDELAREMPDVRFVAINCWQNPACTKYYEFKFYPSISVYVRGLGHIQYPMSSVSKEYLATFIFNIINPVTVISDYLQWSLVRAKHFAVVTVPMGYYQFGYTLALEALRRDPQLRVGYAILAGGSSDIQLHLWNSTLVYDETENPTVAAVSKWVYANTLEPYTFLANPGFKSAKLNQAINGSRAFAIIKSPPSSRLNMHLHNFAVQLYSCPASLNVQTKDMLAQLLAALKAKASTCDQPSRLFECSSSHSECSTRMANVSYVKDWAESVSEWCHETEELALQRVEMNRFCLTQWALPQEEDFVEDYLLLGLACKRDDYFRLIVLDAPLFDRFYPSEAPVVLYNMLEQVKYLLPQSQFTAQGVKIFLNRYLTSSSEQLKKSTALVRRDLYHRRPERFVPPHQTAHQGVRDTVVFFYTGWCGFCKSVMAMYFRVAHFFKLAPITFRRVDAEASRFEDVKYVPDSFPQVVFFLRNSTDSVRYEGAWKPQGLTRFILEHCSEEVIQQL